MSFPKHIAAIVLALSLAATALAQSQQSVNYNLVCWDSAGTLTTLVYRIYEVQGIGAVAEYRSLLTNNRVVPSVGTVGECSVLTSRNIVNALDTIDTGCSNPDTSIYAMNGTIPVARGVFLEHSLTFNHPDTSPIFLISHNDSLVRMVTGDGNGTISARNNYIEMNYTNTGIFYLDGNSAKFQDTRGFGDRAGIEYHADTRTDWNDLTLVTKEYVDDEIANAGDLNGIYSGSGTVSNGVVASNSNGSFVFGKVTKYQQAQDGFPSTGILSGSGQVETFMGMTENFPIMIAYDTVSLISMRALISHNNFGVYNDNSSGWGMEIGSSMMFNVGSNNRAAFKVNASGNPRLEFFSSALHNTAVGKDALLNCSTGASNTALGSEALKTNTTASFNTALGHRALSDNTTGTNNAAFGYQALYRNTTGSNNTAFGTNAGRTIANGITSNTTASNGLYLGHNTKALADGASNETVIGQNATGLGSNTAQLGNTSVIQVGLANLKFKTSPAPGAGDNGKVLAYNHSTAQVELTTPASGADNWGSQVAVTDTTLNGNGTSGNPLSVDTTVIATQHDISTLGGDDWGSQAAVTDTTLNGNGTSGNPLSVDTTILATINNIQNNYLSLVSNTLQEVESSVCFGSLYSPSGGVAITNAVGNSSGTSADRRFGISSATNLFTGFQKGDVVYISAGSPDIPAGYYAIQIKSSNGQIYIDHPGAAGTNLSTATVTAYPNPARTPDTVNVFSPNMTLDDSFTPGGRKPIVSSPASANDYAKYSGILDSVLVTGSNNANLPNGHFKLYEANASTIIIERTIGTMSAVTFTGTIKQIRWTLAGWNALFEVTDSVCFQNQAIFNGGAVVNNLSVDLTPTRVLTVDETTGAVGYAPYLPYDTIDVVIQHTPAGSVIAAGASDDFYTTPLWRPGSDIVSVFYNSMTAGAAATPCRLLITDDSGSTITRFAANIAIGDKWVVGSESSDVSLSTGDKIQLETTGTPDASGLVAIVRIKLPSN